MSLNTTFEEIICLLYDIELPNQERLKDMTLRIGKARVLPDEIKKMIVELEGKTSPMSTLRTVVSALGHYEKNVPLNDLPPKALRLVGQIATAVAMIDRLRKKLPIIDADPEKGHAEDFLRMLTGKEPSKTETQALDLYLILLADHGFNASTFSARVTAGTLANLHSAITSAVGTLSGPLHGGANEKAMELIENWTSRDEAKQKILSMLENKEKIMGFGHAVYSISDPRNAVIKQYAEELSKLHENDDLYQVAEEVEKVMADEKNMFANADFFHAPAYFYMGIPTKLFTPIFVMSRVSGWTAHCMEQRSNNRIIRPSAEYIGVESSEWVDLEDRS